MSTTSNTNNLTTFGNDIINNATYGLKSVNGCGAMNLLSTSDFDTKNNISIYPNPSNGVFAIETTETIYSIKAFDVLGKQIPVKTTSNKQFLIEKSGIYFLKVELENGAILNSKIVIK
jgi:mannan endo-1,4-beta-mannosidase